MNRLLVGAVAASVAALVATSCLTSPTRRTAATGSSAHAAEVMTSAYCGRCHTAIYAEHAQNTHGRAFTDEEVRLATGHFDHGDCIRCHTPRPIFETGIGMNPQRRYYGLEDGNSCMTCHWKQGVDYASFSGGAECKTAFDERVGAVEACASCHRNHGTPYQWESAAHGKRANRTCVTCHMPIVERPIAVGEPARKVRSHLFPASRSESQLRRAYDYDAKVDGNEVVVTVENRGAGHNFPTELKQRSVESVIVVRDLAGVEVARSRMVFRDPYKRPYGLHLPVNTQIPSGESRQHRVPLKVAAGTVDCELHYKLYYPIEDHHPDLSRQLEARRLTFDHVTPSDKPLVGEPEVKISTPESIPAEAAGVANLVDYAHPPIGTVAIAVPEGSDDAAVAALIAMFQFPVPEGNRRAQARLLEIGSPAIPQLVQALGSWDNKTWTQAIAVLGKMDTAATTDAVLQALASDELYVRLHARELAPKLDWTRRRDDLARALLRDLGSPRTIDRASAARAVGQARVSAAAGPLRALLGDADPDTVRAAAVALAQLDARDAVPALAQALARAPFEETKTDLAWVLGALGSSAGIPTLLAQLDLTDDLLREKAFEALFAATGRHFGYDPYLPRDERLARIAALQVAWAQDGGPRWLRRPPALDIPGQVDAKAWGLVSRLGGGDGQMPGGDDNQFTSELNALGAQAVPALVKGLKFPAGFAEKRVLICRLLGQLGARDAGPALAQTLRDPVVAVAAWACWAMEGLHDAELVPAVARYRDRLLTLANEGKLPPALGALDRLLAQAERTRLLLGDDKAKQELVRLLLSGDRDARQLAIDALDRRFKERRGYDPDAPEAQRRAAASRW